MSKAEFHKVGSRGLLPSRQVEALSRSLPCLGLPGVPGYPRTPSGMLNGLLGRRTPKSLESAGLNLSLPSVRSYDANNRARSVPGMCFQQESGGKVRERIFY